jgi:hypothetical protein
MDVMDQLANDPRSPVDEVRAATCSFCTITRSCIHATISNWPEPERHRHLLRLWLAPVSARPLRVFAPRYGSVVPGERGGIVLRGTTRSVVLEAE